MTGVRRSGWSGRSLAVRLLLAQGLVVLASVGTAVAVASFVGPPLFHHHMLEAGQAPSSPELAHIEGCIFLISRVRYWQFPPMNSRKKPGRGTQTP